MASANVDLVRRILAPWRRGDYSSADWAHQWSGRGKTSGLDVARMRTRAATVFHVRDGKVTRLVIYFDQERALDELGLAPETDSRRS